MCHAIAVLLVDDDELVSTCISIWLEDEGFTVYSANSGEAALRLMAENPVDVALVDLQLGELNGEEVIAQACAAHPATQFMVHTGQHYYQLPDRLLELGLQQQNVVFKPILDLDSFVAAIRRSVSGVPKHAVN